MIVFNQPVVLPVTFTSIQALPKNNSNVEISWQVVNQSNMSSYTIERSTDGVHFESIGIINLTDSNSELVSGTYIYTDAGISNISQPLYYRIKGTEISGNKLYSSTVQAVLASYLSGITVYPNPLTQGQLNLKFNNEPAGKYAIRIETLSGQVVYSTELNFAGETSQRSLNFAPVGGRDIRVENSRHVPTGIYTKNIVIESKQ